MRFVRHIKTSLRKKDEVLIKIQTAHQENRVMSIQVVGRDVYITAAIHEEVF